MPQESRADFSGGDDYVLVSVCKNGDRFDLQPALASTASNSANWTPMLNLRRISTRLSDR